MATTNDYKNFDIEMKWGREALLYGTSLRFIEDGIELSKKFKKEFDEFYGVLSKDEKSFVKNLYEKYKENDEYFVYSYNTFYKYNICAEAYSRYKFFTPGTKDEKHNYIEDYSHMSSVPGAICIYFDLSSRTASYVREENEDMEKMFYYIRTLLVLGYKIGKGGSYGDKPVKALDSEEWYPLSFNKFAVSPCNFSSIIFRLYSQGPVLYFKNKTIRDNVYDVYSKL